MQLKRNFFILLLILSATIAHSTDDADTTRKWSFAVSPHYGFIVPHTKQMEHLIQGHSFGVHTYMYRNVSGKKYWHYAYNDPQQGIDVTYNYTGNPSQLGHQFSSSYLLNLPLNHRIPELEGLSKVSSHRYTHWLGLGIGVGYCTKRWDLETNHQAAVIGSKLNVALSLQYSVQLIEFHDSEIRAGLRISHLSNGAFQIPNLGTNNAGVFLSYVLKNPKPELMPLSTAIENYRFTIGTMIGFKEIPPPNGHKHAASVISFLAEKRMTYKSSIGLGVDEFYNSSLRTLMERKSNSEVKPSQVIQLGVLFSYTLHFDQFELKMQQGFYVRDQWKADGVFYHRFGLRYRMTDHVYAQLTLKTHFAKADYGELGLGYAF